MADKSKVNDSETSQGNNDIFSDNSDVFVKNDVVNLKVYYKKGGKMFDAFTEKELSERKKKNPKFDYSDYRIINLWVSPLKWGLFLQLQQDAKELDELGNAQFSSRAFKENKLVTVIKKWDIKRTLPDGSVQEIPINIQNVSNLAPEIAETMLAAYDQYMIIDEDEEKK